MCTIFTIGHSNLDPEHFLALLTAHRIAAIIDVRSNPFSRFVPHFAMKNLQSWLEKANVEYIFMGNELGARRDEESCYIDGQARYDRIASLPIFQQGLQGVLDVAQHRNSALMCAEADPLSCHRTILVCRELLRQRPELQIAHVLANATSESHSDAMRRLVALHKLEPDLFEDQSSATSLIERAQDLQAARIAYSRQK
ncbi:MAG: DUF488 domain-containing protein [Candidatus Hydrogenedentes bacterium]|nr:DUF488 domain-containing protein [Candidatus Hydrogenedentota bacterium]